MPGTGGTAAILRASRDLTEQERADEFARLIDPSHVRIQLTETDPLQVPEHAGESRPIAVVDAEGLGDVVTWFAYDENDGEIVVSPRPPS